MEEPPQIVENSSDCAIAPWTLRANNVKRLAAVFGNNPGNGRTAAAIIRALQKKGGWKGLTKDDVMRELPTADEPHRLDYFIEHSFLRERGGLYFATIDFLVRCLRATS